MLELSVLNRAGGGRWMVSRPCESLVYRDISARMARCYVGNGVNMDDVAPRSGGYVYRCTTWLQCETIYDDLIDKNVKFNSSI
jgi:hypothetical protein